MADKDLLLVPGVAARIATWAAQDGREDALERGDAASEVLASAGLWGWGGTWSLDKMDYDASFDSTRLAFWKSGEGLYNAPLLGSDLTKQAEELYTELYPGLVNSWPVLRGVAVAAANKGSFALALLRGNQAARAALEAGEWNVIQWGLYTAKSDASKIAFWAAGGDDFSVKAPTPAPTPDPKPTPGPAPAPTTAPSSGGGKAAVAVVAVVAAVWLSRRRRK